VLVVNIRLLLCCFRPMALTSSISSLVAVALFFLVLCFLGEVSLGQKIQPTLTSVPKDMFTSGTVMATLVGSVLAALSVDAAEIVLRRIFPSKMDQALKSARAASSLQAILPPSAAAYGKSEME
ncbi:unnamed protein product, partial [Polarella glacialis]